MGMSFEGNYKVVYCSFYPWEPFGVLKMYLHKVKILSQLRNPTKSNQII